MTRSSRRSRLWAGGSFWRSVEYGESANLIQLTCLEDLTGSTPEGVLVVQHRGIKTDEQIFATGFSAQPEVKLFGFSLSWNEELRLTNENGVVRAKKYGIRWQIAGGEELLAEYGEVSPSRLTSYPGVSFSVSYTGWPVGAMITMRPRVHRYPLVETSVTDPVTMTSSTGWDIQALRATLNGSDTWVRMPNRAAAVPPGSGPLSGGEDKMDGESDTQFLSPFVTVNMSGGDGLPANPAGLNTGPDRALIHLNYAEREDSTMGVLNYVYEWVGLNQTQGSWQRYA